MNADDRELTTLARAIAANDQSSASSLLAASPELATAALRQGATGHAASEYFLTEISHQVYAGDTALHLAAAAHQPQVVRLLLALGADVGARNRRGAEPLHYAVDGGPGSAAWDPPAQAETVTCLIEAGADPNSSDKGGVTPLHRAVRNRSAVAVQALLDGGADARRVNGSGSTPMQLATWTTGRGGAGSPESKAQQAQIVQLLRLHGTRD